MTDYSMTNHPMMPTDDQMGDWRSKALDRHPGGLNDNAPVIRAVSQMAYSAGADAELEACCEWIKKNGWSYRAEQLRSHRRPSPLSMKEQAMKDLDTLIDDLKRHGMGVNTDAIRRALEQLND